MDDFSKQHFDSFFLSFSLPYLFFFFLDLFSQKKKSPPPPQQPKAKPFELHVGSTTLSLPFNSQRASELRAALSLLLATFAEKAKAERPKRWQSLEYRFKSGSDGGNEGGGDSGNEGGGDSGSSTPPGIAFFEVFCNPNAAASPFDAKVLVTVRSTNGGVGFTTEAPLSALRADLEAFCASS